MISSQIDTQANVLKASMEALDRLKKRLTLSKGKNADVLSLEKELKKLPSPDEINSILSQIKGDLSNYVASEKNRLRSTFDTTLTQYISSLKSSNVSHRILSQYRARVGALMMEANPDRLSARFLYNDEPLVDWTIVRLPEDYGLLETEAKLKIEKYSMPEDTFITSLIDAVDELSLKTKTDAKFVRIQDIYPEIIVQRIRRDIGRSKGRGRLTPIEYPFYAFLYNLDKYKSKSSVLPQEKQLTFHTGSQVETESIGVTLNGLDLEQPYKRFCFVTRR